MILASIKMKSELIACIVIDEQFFPIPNINRDFNCDWPTTIFNIISTGQLDSLTHWVNDNKSYLKNRSALALGSNEIQFGPLYTTPEKIWGIGLNYRDHAEDLNEKTPTGIPASFMKPNTTIIGHENLIKIPKMSSKTTGEAELGVIIGKECKDINQGNWLDYVAGYTSIIDMTAEDILRKNPRYLTVCKSFDTFFSFGPFFYTKDEVIDVTTLKVSTVINGKVWAENFVSNMTFKPDFLVSFHSKVMTLKPGDIISTGTPKATPLSHNDVIECKISGFKTLTNSVVDLKKISY